MSINEKTAGLQTYSSDQVFAQCEGCGIQLSGNLHRYCLTCVQWAVAINAIGVARSALDEAAQ